MVVPRILLVAVVLMTACAPDIPSGVLLCDDNRLCPEGFECSDDGFCVDDLDAATRDGGADDATALDAGLDAAALDAGGLDAGGLDAGGLDVGTVDAGGLDVGTVDVGTVDSGTALDSGTECGPTQDCSDGMECTDTGICVEGCGAEGQECCADDGESECEDLLGCFDSACQACGGIDEPCCPPGSLSEGCRFGSMMCLGTVCI